MWAVFGTLVVLLITLVVIFERVFHTYWEKRGVSTPKGGLPIVGHLHRLITGESWTYVNDTYNQFKKERFFGFYELNKPRLFVCDVELIKQILVKEFDSFADRRDMSMGTTEENEYLNEMLVSLNGVPWKRLRSTMSPTFSSGKMKHMYTIIQHHAKKLLTHCELKMKSDNKVDIKRVFGMFTMDVIASTAFGIECNSLTKEDPIFAKTAEKIFVNSPLAMIKLLLILLMPRVCKMLNIQAVDETWNFFKNVSTETLKERRETREKRGDFLDLILEQQEKQKTEFEEKEDYAITDKTILAQSVMFLVAGYDNSSNTLSVICYFLAKHPEIQNRLRDELNEIFDDTGNAEYHDLMEAKYLDACISEAFRVIPGITVIERSCTREYKIPNSNITIPQGMMVEIPVWGLHHDPEFWENPDDYKPERFLPENKSKLTPFAYMPFGLGPRNCIAMRFALMEIKICLAYLVHSNEINLAPGHEELKLENAGGAVRPIAGSLVMEMKKI